MKKWFLAPIIVLFSVSSILAQGIDFVENKSWQEILTMAGDQKKLVFLDCYTTWCGPCKAMAKDVFPLPEVGTYMNANFVNAKLDMEKGEGIELNKKYKKYIPGYPTYLLINAQGEVMHQVAGYNAADKFIAKIGDGLKQKSWIAASAKFDAGQRDWEFLQEYLTLLEDAFQTTKIKEVTKDILPGMNVALISESPAAYKIFRKYWTDVETPLMRAFLVNAGVYRKHKDPEKEVNEWAGRLYRRAVDAYVQKSTNTPAEFDSVKANQLIVDLYKVNVATRENSIALMLLSKAVVKKDGSNFIKLTNAATDFGMLRYDTRVVSNWARNLAAQTNDKALLKKYLACTEVQEGNVFVTAADIRNHAFILERIGDKAKAKEFYAKADKAEAEQKEKYKSFINSSK